MPYILATGYNSHEGIFENILRLMRFFPCRNNYNSYIYIYIYIYIYMFIYIKNKKYQKNNYYIKSLQALGYLADPGALFENVIQMKRFGSYFEIVLNKK